MLKPWFIRYRTRKAQKELPEKDKQIDFSQGKKFGLLINLDEDWLEVAQELEEGLKEAGKEVHQLGYLFGPPKEHSITCVEHKQINWWGLFKEGQKPGFLNQHFDFLVVFDQELDYLGNYLATLSQKECTVGLCQENTVPHWDFQLRCKKSEPANYLLKYLKMIHS
jgi:hypothetical protein